MDRLFRPQYYRAVSGLRTSVEKAGLGVQGAGAEHLPGSSLRWALNFVARLLYAILYKLEHKQLHRFSRYQ